MLEIDDVQKVMSESCVNRWALYPPGRVPAGVVVHVNEEDGDVNIETPSSLQVSDVERSDAYNYHNIYDLFLSSTSICCSCFFMAFSFLTVVAGLLSTS